MSKGSRPKRVRDKWRAKKWFSVYAPPYLGDIKLAETPVVDPGKLIGRKIEVSLYELIGDITQDYVAVDFLITGVDGERATTTFRGHHYTRDFIKVKVRRRRMLIEGIFTLVTKDNYMIRVTVMIITVQKMSVGKSSAMRRIAKEYLEARASELSFADLVREIILGKVASELTPRIRKISPIEFVGIIKSKLIKVPENRQKT